MSYPTYPNDTLDCPATLLQHLGSVWTDVHPDRDFLETRARMRLEMLRQHHTTIQEAADAVSRQTVPLYQTKHWHAIYLTQSDQLSDAYCWPLNAENLQDVAIIANRITDPTAVLHRDIDFTIDASNNTITFLTDPFENSLFPQTVDFTDGVVSSAEIMLWLCNAQFDTDLVYSHLGYVLDLNLATSQAYKDLLNAIIDATVDGSSLAALERVVSLLYDIPIVSGSQETVEAVTSLGDNLVIVTDQNAYRCAPDATAPVSAGDVVVAGDQLVDGFKIHDFRDGTIPEGLTDITLEDGMLVAGLGRITFANNVYDITVTGEDNRVSWPLGGAADDVEEFWDIVHDRRDTYGASLYELLAASEGGSILAVPTQVNPLQFLVEHVLRNNAMLVVVNQDAIGPNALSVDKAAILRKILPPHCALLIEET